MSTAVVYGGENGSCVKATAEGGKEREREAGVSHEGGGEKDGEEGREGGREREKGEGKRRYLPLFTITHSLSPLSSSSFFFPFHVRTYNIHTQIKVKTSITNLLR